MNESITCIYRVGAQSVLPKHWQGRSLCLPDSKFYYVEKGELWVEMNGERFTAKTGDLVLIPANTCHSCGLTEIGYAEKSWCHFSLKQGTSDFFESYYISPFIHVKDHTAVSKLFQHLLSSSNKPADQAGLTATTALCQLVQYYFENADITPRHTGNDRIRQVADYINTHYTETVTLQQLARLAGYSATHLSKRFRDVMGVPPIRYLNNVRIEQAKYLLQFTHLPVARIMEKCGFTDAAYFSRAFKSVIGYSPQAFRGLHPPQK